MQEVKQPSKRPLVFYYLIGMLILMVLNMTFFPSVLQKQVQEVSYSTFMSMTMDDNIGKVQIEGEEITFTDKAQENIYKTTAIDSDTGMVQRVYDHGGDINRVDTQPGLLTSILVGWVLPLLPFLLIGWFINRRMKKSMGGDGMMFGMGGGSNAKMYVPSSTGIRFADVAGEDEAKELLSEIVDFLRDPEKYSALGARIPKGVLLVGPPGTGKTLLARAVAGESGVTFIQKNATEFFKSMVGEGPGAVREVFRIARKYAPTVLFVDEIDAIGRVRTGRACTPRRNCKTHSSPSWTASPSTKSGPSSFSPRPITTSTHRAADSACSTPLLFAALTGVSRSSSRTRRSGGSFCNIISKNMASAASARRRWTALRRAASAEAPQISSASSNTPCASGRASGSPTATSPSRWTRSGTAKSGSGARK